MAPRPIGTLTYFTELWLPMAIKPAIPPIIKSTMAVPLKPNFAPIDHRFRAGGDGAGNCTTFARFSGCEDLDSTFTDIAFVHYNLARRGDSEHYRRLLRHLGRRARQNIDLAQKCAPERSRGLT